MGRGVPIKYGEEMSKTTREKYLEALGIEVWKEKTAPISANNEIREPPKNSTSWQVLYDEIKSCERCPLCKSRTNVVFGVGNPNAKLLVIGEAPGANEDLKGEPFVGRAGMLLNSMLLAIGLRRQDIYIANILKCRPPNNRDPAPEEVALCTPYLLNQIALIKPKIILAVGRIAAHFLLNTDESMGRLRGKHYTYGPDKTPLLITYHPAYLLRSPREKSKAYQDLLLVKKALGKL